MQEFKAKMQQLLQDAKAAGLSDEEILLELMEQTKILLSKVSMKIAGVAR